MWNRFLDFICPVRIRLQSKLQFIEHLLSTIESLEANINKLEDVIATNKTTFTTEISKLAVTSHAIHRFRERHKGQGTDEDISKMLTKLLMQQLYTMDKLQDGQYTLKKGIVGVVKNNTLVTIIPTRDYGKPKLK